MRQIAIVKDYDELMAALRGRVDELKITRLQLDEALSTLPDGYASKLLAPVPIRALGRVSLGPMLQTLGLAIVIVEDLSSVRRIASQRTRAIRARETMPAKKRKTKRGFRGSEMGRLLRARQILLHDPNKRRRIARRAARIRWKRERDKRRPGALLLPVATSS